MIIRNSFTIPLPVEEAWKTLTDVESIVTCVPGAELTEKTDDTIYKGTIAVRLGPVALKFKGTAQFIDLNEDEYRANMKARGADANGRGGADAMVTFSVEPEGDGKSSTALIETDIKLSGSIAQYGRGEGMINDLASMLTDQFAECLRAKLSQRSAAPDNDTNQEVPEQAASAAKPISGLSLIFKVIRNSVLRFFGKG